MPEPTKMVLHTTAHVASVAATGSTTVAGVGISAASVTMGSVSGTMLSAGGATVFIPVAGWVIGAGLLAIGGTIAIVSALRKKGKRQAEEVAAKYGPQGKFFVREYVRMAKKPPGRLVSEAASLQKQIDKLPKGRRDKKREKLVDRLNAVLAVLQGRVQEPTAPAVAGERDTLPVVAKSAPSYNLDDVAAAAESAPGWLIGGLLAGAAYALW